MPALTNDSGMRVGVIPGRVLPNSLTATIIVKGSYFLRPDGVVEPVPEDDQPHLNSDLFWDDDPARGCRIPSDFAPFKPGADLLLAAHAHSPNRQAVQFLQVSFGVGPFRKPALVVGDRYVRTGVLGNKLSDPVPFKSLPLDWSRAYGGPGYATNPVGRGIAESALRDGMPVRMAPNIQSVAGAGSDPLANPSPIGFGPIGQEWSPRAERIGTFNAAWLAKQWPWYPEDIDWKYFNAAPGDQYLDGLYLRGDESMEFVNLHAEYPVLATRLAGRQPRCFIYLRRKGTLDFQEVLLRLDTLLADLDAGQVHLTWRGVAAVDTRKFKELEQLFVLEESIHAPLASSLDGYQAACEEKKKRQREKFKIPPITFDQPSIPQLSPLSTTWADRLAKMMGEVKAAANQAVAALPPIQGPTGATIPKLPVPPPPPPPLTIKAAEAIKKADLEALAKIDPRLPDAHPLPDLADFEDDDVDEPEETEGEPIAGEGEWTRESVLARVAERGSLDGQDLAGLDLSLICFDDISLREADLDGCDLSGATFVRSNLFRASLRGVALAGATLEAANLERADLSEIKADRVPFVRANLASADFSDASLVECCLDEVTGAGAVFSGAELMRSSFIRANLPGADFSKARLAGANFLEAHLATCDFDRADARGAKFEGVTARNVRASKANFDGASFRNCAADMAVFEESRFVDVDFRGASLVRVTLTGSYLDRAVFGLADIRWGQLDDIQAPGATFVGVNLFRGSLENARLDGARIINCNFYQAELEGISLEKALLEDVNLKGTKREP